MIACRQKPQQSVVQRAELLPDNVPEAEDFLSCVGTIHLLNCQGRFVLHASTTSTVEHELCLHPAQALPNITDRTCVIGSFAGLPDVHSTGNGSSMSPSAAAISFVTRCSESARIAWQRRYQPSPSSETARARSSGRAPPDDASTVACRAARESSKFGSSGKGPPG